MKRIKHFFPSPKSSATKYYTEYNRHLQFNILYIWIDIHWRPFLLRFFFRYIFGNHYNEKVFYFIMSFCVIGWCYSLTWQLSVWMMLDFFLRFFVGFFCLFFFYLLIFLIYWNTIRMVEMAFWQTIDNAMTSPNLYRYRLSANRKKC